MMNLSLRRRFLPGLVAASLFSATLLPAQPASQNHS
jgi:hypothetical protein